MTLRRVLVNILRSLGLLLAFLVLFSASTAFVPADLVASQPHDAAARAAAARALLVVGVLDVAILGAIAVSSRLRGLRLWALLSGFGWFVMTFTSQLEAAYFMRNVTPQMMPWLLAMTLPVCVLFPPVLMAAFGLWRRAPELAPAWRAPAMGAGERAFKVAALSAVVYPVLFFGAGYFIAWQSPAVREFYSGSTALVGSVEHYLSLFSSDPKVYPFEVLRGLLWVGAALLVLRTTRGPAWWGTLLVALSFCFIQNDLLLLSNPLMPPEVCRAHFLETGSSNFVWALCIGWWMHRSHGRAVTAAPSATPAHP